MNTMLTLTRAITNLIGVRAQATRRLLMGRDPLLLMQFFPSDRGRIQLETFVKSVGREPALKFGPSCY